MFVQEPELDSGVKCLGTVDAETLIDRVSAI